MTLLARLWVRMNTAKSLLIFHCLRVLVEELVSHLLLNLHIPLLDGLVEVDNHHGAVLHKPLTLRAGMSVILRRVGIVEHDMARRGRHEEALLLVRQTALLYVLDHSQSL